ncbi:MULTISPECIES: hypothetical protein [Roseomonadaceae]|uniref:ArsR family transcriptional regulator n=1 Tax=Falsiroseomonas oleicola TaxID=2801474 RepID=A0ABS6H6K7_9PROT|nr:hypothetical protein [Roseomonas oleicola]MBU8544321.1 hypothetical protein [Roseomonas oleicola]
MRESLRSLPLGARCLLLLLADAAAQSGHDETLPFSDTPSLAVVAHAEEAEIAEHIATLIDQGLLAVTTSGRLRVVALTRTGGIRRLARLVMQPHAGGGRG